MPISHADIFLIAKQIFPNRSVTVVDFKITKKLGNIQGFLSSSLFLQIEVKENGQSKIVTCFLKAMPADNDVQRNYALNTKAFIKEVFFYNKFAKDMLKFSTEKVFPACYLARENDVIVLEHLGDCSIKDINDLFTLEEMKAAIKSLAIFHSSSIIFESKYNVKLDNIGEEYLTEHYYKREDGHFGLLHMQAGIKAFKALIKKYLEIDAKTEKLVYSTYEKIPEMLVSSTKYRNVICHGDVYGNNLMFSRVQGKLKVYIVDFQLVRFSPPGFDLILILNSNFEEALWHQHYDELVSYYYECVESSLESFGLDVSIEFPKENFMEGLEDVKLTALAVSSLFQHYVTIPEKELEKIQSDVKLLEHFLLEDRTDVVLAMCESSPIYRTRVCSSINCLITECKKRLAS